MSSNIYLLCDPIITRAYQRDPRFAAFCKRAGLQPPGQALHAAASSSRY